MPGTPTIARQELAAYVQETFENLGLVDRSTILKALEYKRAPREAIGLVADRVPEGVRMTEMRVLWHYLGDVPVDRLQP